MTTAHPELEGLEHYKFCWADSGHGRRIHSFPSSAVAGSDMVLRRPAWGRGGPHQRRTMPRVGLERPPGNHGNGQARYAVQLTADPQRPSASARVTGHQDRETA
jgi:hypothetical protein